MLEKLVGIEIKLLPKEPKENEKLCDTCGGTGWLYEKDNGYIEHCPVCYNGVITLCPTCKQPKRGMCMNVDCRNQQEQISEQKRLDKAIKISYEDAPDFIKEIMFSELYPDNEGYFDDIGELIERCNDDEIPIPEYVWSTSKYKISMDSSRIIENACEELHEDAYQNIIDEMELQEFLDKWCDKQTGTDTYTVDYKYAIRVPQADQ